MRSCLELIKPSSMDEVSLVRAPSCSNIRSMRDVPYWTCRKSSLGLTALDFLM